MELTEEEEAEQTYGVADESSSAVSSVDQLLWPWLYVPASGSDQLASNHLLPPTACPFGRGNVCNASVRTPDVGEENRQSNA